MTETEDKPADSLFKARMNANKPTEESQNPINPNHYQLAIQPIEYIEANELGFCEGNVIKYVSRWQGKNGVEDLKKARQYLDFLINKAEGKPVLEKRKD